MGFSDDCQVCEGAGKLEDLPEDVPERYRAYYMAARSVTSEPEARAIIQENVRDDRELAAGRCPRCSGPIDKKLDERQGGPSRVQGLWYRYRCGRCQFMVDQIEAD
jgi:DNA-directed RNA polymerase subunit RPC12/RpoP